jgi:hypothetical protein
MWYGCKPITPILFICRPVRYTIRSRCRRSTRHHRSSITTTVFLVLFPDIQNRCHGFAEGHLRPKFHDTAIGCLHLYWFRAVGWYGTSNLACQILVLAPTSTHWYIAHGTTSCPVPLAVLTKMSWLVNIVIIVITEFGVHAVAPRAW